MDVFTYGSLMFPQVWNAVVKGEYRSHTGCVRGFLRRAVKNETYPGLIRNGKATEVAGRVYFDVGAPDLQRLDRFEGAYYRREAVTVGLDEGGEVRAQVYLFRDEYRTLLASHDWDVAWFEREGMARFLGGYKGFSCP